MDELEIITAGKIVLGYDRTNRSRVQLINIREAARFIVTGVTATIGNMCAVCITRRFSTFEVALLFGVSTGFLISFLMSKLYAFRSGSWRQFHLESLRFVAVYLIGAAVYWTVGFALGRHILPRLFDPRIAELMGAFLGASCMAFTSYFGHRFFTYRTAETAGSPGPDISPAATMGSYGRNRSQKQNSAAAAWVLLPLFAAFYFAFLFKQGSQVVGIRSLLNAAYDAATRGTFEVPVPQSVVLYNRVVISVDYFRGGFIRRGLGGTLAYLMSPDFEKGAVLFQTLSLTLLCAGLSAILVLVGRRRSWPMATYMALVIGFSPQTFQLWRVDVARTDILAVAFLVWATLATICRARLVGAIILVSGYLLHETVVIYGAPLLLVLNGVDVIAARLTRRRALGLVVGSISVLLGIVVLQAMFSPSASITGGQMIRFSPTDLIEDQSALRDIAIFMATSGIRGLKDAICYNTSFNHQYGFMIISSLLILVIYIFILFLKSHLLEVGLCVLLPTSFMLVIAMDTGRWLSFATANAWLLSASLQLASVKAHQRSGSMMFGVALLAMLSAMGPTTVNAVNRVAEALSTRLGMPRPGTYESWLAECDPTWRDFVHGRVEASSRR